MEWEGGVAGGSGLGKRGGGELVGEKDSGNTGEKTIS